MRNSRNRLLADDQSLDKVVTSTAAAGESGTSGEAAVVSRLELMPEEVCPICQEEMTSDMPLTYCRYISYSISIQHRPMITEG
jgi:hypothetical protein